MFIRTILMIIIARITIFRLRATKNVVMFLIGFLGFLTGSYVSIRNIITFFVNGGD